MLQPVPFYPGSNFNAHMGAAYSGHGVQGESLGTTFVPGNISIRLRAGIPEYYPFLITLFLWFCFLKCL